MNTPPQIDRRAALAIMGTTLGALTAGGPSRATDNAPPSGPRFALRSPMPGGTLAERAALAAKIGFDGLELGGGDLFAPPAEEILASLKGTGLAVSAVSADQKHLDPDPAVRRAALEENKRRLEKAQALGAAGLVVVPVFGKTPKFSRYESGGRPHLNEDRLLVATLKQLAPVAQQCDVKIIMEPLTRLETYYLNLQGHALDIVEQVGSPAVGILTDFYHMQMDEQDLVAALRECAHRTYYVHVADGAARTVPGTLPFDYRPGFAVLKEKGYRGWITIEARPTGIDDLAAALAKSLNYLKQQWQQA